MNTSSPRVTRLNRRARILLAVGGAVLVIALVAVALLAFDPPLLARLSRHLPGAATPVCAPGDNCPDSCSAKEPPTLCYAGSYPCGLQPIGNCRDIDLTYVLSNGLLVLEGGWLERCNLEGSTLSGSLRGAHLKGANLKSANLTGVDLTGADLRDTDLTDANLTDANLTGASESHNTIMNGTKFCRTTMPSGRISNPDCQ